MWISYSNQISFCWLNFYQKLYHWPWVNNDFICFISHEENSFETLWTSTSKKFHEHVEYRQNKQYRWLFDTTIRSRVTNQNLSQFGAKLGEKNGKSLNMWKMVPKTTSLKVGIKIGSGKRKIILVEFVQLV